MIQKTKAAMAMQRLTHIVIIVFLRPLKNKKKKSGLYNTSSDTVQFSQIRQQSALLYDSYKRPPLIG